jgi:MFS family permease
MFSVVGCLILPWLAARIGRRRTLALLFALMFCGIFGIFGWGYHAHSMTASFAFIPVLGPGSADSVVFTVWLPDQYPTEIRAAAFAFCTTISRFAVAAATFLVGDAIVAANTIG